MLRNLALNGPNAPVTPCRVEHLSILAQPTASCRRRVVPGPQVAMMPGSDSSQPKGMWEKILWLAMDLCVAAEQRRVMAIISAAAASSGNNNNRSYSSNNNIGQLPIPSPALRILSVDFDAPQMDGFVTGAGGEGPHANVSIIRPLITTPAYRALTRLLEGLFISNNRFDESADALLVPNASNDAVDENNNNTVVYFEHMREIRFTNCHGMRSLRCLRYFCRENLEIIVASKCPKLVSLEGLEEGASATDKVFSALEHLDLSETSITSIRELSGDDGSTMKRKKKGTGGRFPSLKVLELRSCTKLVTLEGGVEELHQLEQLDISDTRLQHIRPLTRLQNLKRIDVSFCFHLRSLVGLQNHSKLEMVTAPKSGITSLAALRKCLALRWLNCRHCYELQSLKGLENHPVLEYVNVTNSDRISSIRELKGCLALKQLTFLGCHKVDTLEDLADHRHLEALDASCTDISSLQPLWNCKTLTFLAVSDCERLPASERNLPGIDIINQY